MVANSVPQGRRRLFATTLLAGAVSLAGGALAQTAPGGANQNGQNSAAPVATPQGAQNAGQVSSAGVSQSGAPGATAEQPPTPSTAGDVANQPSAAANANASQEVVVTGTILRRKLSATDAPITTITSTELSQRGITTVADGVQQISANSAGALPGAFTSNGAFAAGASAASLRGLTTNSTLTLIDGLRTAYYPLADDGTRNFVDLNTIPDVIVDQVQTLKDGASATYGADAIAGVVNIITKKTYQGLTFNAEGGGSQHGGGGENHYSLLVGHGDLNTDGYNVYLGVEYEHDDALYNRDRGYPYNTDDQSQTCGVSLVDGSRTCRTNGIVNGLQFDGSFQGVGSNIVPVVRPYTVNGDGTFTAAGDYQLLNKAAGCGALKSVTVTPDQATAGGADGIINGPVTLCQQDIAHDYRQISPDDKRFSVSIRGTKRFGNNTEAYFTANYYQNDVIEPSYTGPASLRDQATPGAVGIAPYSSANVPGLTLPVYVCSSGVNCNATNGTLNPNNPFAAAGQVAQINYLFGDIPHTSEQFVQTYRFAGGLKGEFNLFGDWHYSVDVTGAQSDLKNTMNGNIYIDGLISAINTGAYNFVNPSMNTQAVRNMIAPEVDQYSTSKLGMVQVNLSHDLMTLPGGPLQLGLSGAIRYESIYNPSANPEPGEQMSTARYFSINPFGVVGSRNVRSGAFELDAPILKQIDVDLSGRYDDYSTGADNFSPKIGGRIKPFADWAPQFDKITLRSTYSQGFRIPSLAESNSVAPITGYETATAPAAFLAAHNDGYGQNYALGLQQVANPNLKPERSENFTAGIVLDPIPQVSLSFDFYRIKKRDFITPDTSNFSEAINAYYAGTPVPTGYSVVPGIPDPNHPNLQPELGFITYQFTNLGTETTSGYDIGGTARFNLPYGIRYTSVFDGNYVLRLNLDPMNGGAVQHYAGTIAPYADVAAGGTPKFRANWQNTLQYGKATVSITAYFTDGYDLQAEDQGDVTGVCIADGKSASQINATYLDGVTPVACKVKPFWQFDSHIAYDVTKHVQLYMDVLNMLDENSPYDPTTYGGIDYNSTFAGAGIIGRYFKVGLRATF